MEKKKKRIIIASLLVGVIVSLLLLSSAVFKIRSVTVEDQTHLLHLKTEDLNNMLEVGDMPIGSSIFFTRFDDNIKAMEKAYPYVKINGIERKFPSDVIIYVSERVPVVRVKYGSKTYVLDSDLKILNIVIDQSEFITETAEKDVPELIVGMNSNININFDGKEKGDFIENSGSLKEYVSALYHGAVFTSNDSHNALSCISAIKSVRIDYKKELGKISFYIEYNDTDIVSTIDGDKDLTDTIYEVVSCVRKYSADTTIAYINATDGVVYEGRK